MKQVFCDESGYTGNNLWQSDQPHFAYAAVEIENCAAQDLLDEARQKYSIKATEFHAASLLKRTKGTRALQFILERVSPLSTVAVFHKRYSLAGKMFEYLIEPIISDRSYAFYNIGLHKFVANGLYFASLANRPGAETAIVEFQELMGTGETKRLDAIIDAMLEVDPENWAP